MKTQKHLVIIVCLGLLILGIFSLIWITTRMLSPSVRIERSKNEDPLITFEPVRDNKFREQIAKGVDLNSGITIYQGLDFPVYSTPARNPNIITFEVHSHVGENIIFRDQTFNLNVYSFDMSSGKWQIIKLPYNPGNEPKSLPPKLERFDSKALNIGDIDLSELNGLNNNSCRIFILGIGSSTGRKYGAYIDVTLKK